MGAPQGGLIHSLAGSPSSVLVDLWAYSPLKCSFYIWGI